jgi:antitoxin YefM
MIKITYTQARRVFASLLDRVTDVREIAIITRRGSKDVAVVAANELAGLLETAHLPANAKRLLTALHRAQSSSRRVRRVTRVTPKL